MNEIVNKFLLAGHKCMPEMHIRQPKFTYSACGPFTKIKERMQKINKKKTNQQQQEIYDIFIKTN